MPVKMKKMAISSSLARKDLCTVRTTSHQDTMMEDTGQCGSFLCLVPLMLLKLLLLNNFPGFATDHHHVPTITFPITVTSFSSASRPCNSTRTVRQQQQSVSD